MKRLVSMVVVLMLVVSAMAPSFADVKNIELKDVPKNHWSYQFVQKAINYGLMDAPNGVFNPKKEVTRAEFLNMIAKMYMPSDVKYSDPESVYFTKLLPEYPAVRYMTDMGFYFKDKSVRRSQYLYDTLGLYGNDYFKLVDSSVKQTIDYYKQPITKLEVAYIISRLASSRIEVLSKGARFKVEDDSQSDEFHIEPITVRTKLPSFVWVDQPVYFNGKLMYDGKLTEFKSVGKIDPGTFLSSVGENRYSAAVVKYVYDQGFFVNPDKTKFDYGKFNPTAKLTREAIAKVVSLIYEKTSKKSTEMKFEDIYTRIIVKEENGTKTLYVYGNAGNLEEWYKKDKNVKIVRVKDIKEQQDAKGKTSHVATFGPYLPGYTPQGLKDTTENRKKLGDQLVNTIFSEIKVSDEAMFNTKDTFNLYFLGYSGGCNGVAGGYLQAYHGIFAPINLQLTDLYDKKIKPGDVLIESNPKSSHMFAVLDIEKDITLHGSAGSGRIFTVPDNLKGLTDNNVKFVSDTNMIIVAYLDEKAMDPRNNFQYLAIDSLYEETSKFYRGNGVLSDVVDSLEYVTEDAALREKIYKMFR